MSEKFEMPYHDRAVGLPKEYSHLQEQYERKLSELSEIWGRRKVEGFEIEKSERDLEIIQFVEGAAREFAKRYGRAKEIVISPERIHLFRMGGVEEFTEGHVEGGSHGMIPADIIIDRQSQDAQFAIMLFHELSHLQGFKVVQFKKEVKKEESPIFSRRSGFSIDSESGDSTYFYYIEEALVGLLERAFYQQKVKNNSMFDAKEREMVILSRQDEIRDFIKIVDAIVEKEGISKKDKDLFFARQEEIIKIFMRAHFTGRFLEVARLVERALGKGAFRELAEQTKRTRGD